jgi:hypothetical protein
MRIQIFLCLLALTILAGCCGPSAFTAERVKEINDQWYKMYQSDRRQIKAEAEEYAGLTDEQKIEWRKAGKPTDRALSTRTLDATEDFFKAVNLEIEAAGEDKKEE